jgi:hypothetical protein
VFIPKVLLKNNIQAYIAIPKKEETMPEKPKLL